ncbi:uroporphyrinogen-III C-methyltransferase, partial [Tsukamurella pulmonis]
RPAETPAAVVENATTGGQRTVRGTLASIAADAAAANVVPPAVLVVGPTAGFLAAQGA